MESKVSDAVLYCSWPIPPHSGNICRMRWKTNFNSCTLQKSTTRCNRTPLNVYWLHNCITSIFSATPSMYVWKRQIKKPTHFVLGEENWSWLQLCVLKGQIQRDQIASTMNTYISVSHQRFSFTFRIIMFVFYPDILIYTTFSLVQHPQCSVEQTATMVNK